MPVARRPLVAHRAFAHPLWLGALVLLVVNDRLLKGSGLLPGVITGKLSDVAGLLVAPAVLSALLAVTSRRGFLFSHLAVGAVFSAIKLSPPAASVLEGLSRLTPFAWKIAVDPTDLLALPALLLSARYLMEAAAGADRAPLLVSRLLLAASSLACLASSEPAQHMTNPFPTMSNVPPRGALFITNDTGNPATLRVRAVRDGVSIACGMVQGSPSSMLSRDDFAPAELWRVNDGESLPLQASQNECTAYLVDGDGLGQSIVFFTRYSYPTQTLGERSGAEITLSRTGPILTLSEHEAVFPAPTSAGEALDDPACQLPSPEASIDWSTPVPAGTSELLSITSAPDGCHALDLASGRFYLCAPLPSLPCKPGDAVEVSTFYRGATDKPVEGLEVKCGDGLVRLARGADLTFAGKPTPFTVHKTAGCAATRVGCGEVALPFEVSYGGSTLRPGGELQKDDHSRILLVRAQQMLVVDKQCSPEVTAGDPLLESVYVYDPTPAQALLTWLLSMR